MLPDLDAINWGTYEHAYGRADDVPAMLRGMIDPARADAAFEAFAGAVNHQGWASAAAAPCMPWLVAALDEPGVPRARLVRLLADLAIGGSHDNWLGDRLAVGGPPELRDPVLAVHDRFVALLADDAPDVRAAATVALAVLHERADAGRVALRVALERERKADVKASLVLAVGILGDDTDLARVTAARAGKRVARAVRVATACARAWLAPAATTRDDLLELFAEVGVAKRAKAVPWADGDLGTLAERVALWTLPRLAAEDVTALLAVVDKRLGSRIVATLVPRSFPEHGPRLEDPTALDAGQRTALLLVADHEDVLRGWIGDRLQAAGVPRTTRGLRVWLGLEPGGLLDRRVGSRVLWRELRRVFLGQRDVAELAAELAAMFEPSEAVAALDELLVDKHHHADIAFAPSRPGYSHEDAPVVEPSASRLAGILAELVRPVRGLREPAETRLAPLLGVDYPHKVTGLVWLRVLAALGELDPRWDPLVGRLMQAPPASRAPLQLGEVLRAMPLPRREALVLAVPLVRMTGSTTKSGDEVVFAWQAAWGGEGWWFLPACPTPAVADAVVDAVRVWSTLPPMPDPATIPPRCFAEPHAPFPYARFRELVAAWGPDLLRPRLEALAADGGAGLAAELLALVAGPVAG